MITFDKKYDIVSLSHESSNAVLSVSMHRNSKNVLVHLTTGFENMICQFPRQDLIAFLEQLIARSEPEQSCRRLDEQRGD